MLMNTKVSEVHTIIFSIDNIFNVFFFRIFIKNDQNVLRPHESQV